MPLCPVSLGKSLAVLRFSLEKNPGAGLQRFIFFLLFLSRSCPENKPHRLIRTATNHTVFGVKCRQVLGLASITVTRESQEG